MSNKQIKLFHKQLKYSSEKHKQLANTSFFIAVFKTMSLLKYIEQKRTLT